MLKKYYQKEKFVDPDLMERILSETGIVSPKSVNFWFAAERKKEYRETGRSINFNWKV